MPSPSAPSWRKIETALIDLLRVEGFELFQGGGNTSVRVYPHPNAEYVEGIEIQLGDFARELEERL